MHRSLMSATWSVLALKERVWHREMMRDRVRGGRAGSTHKFVVLVQRCQLSSLQVEGEGGATLKGGGIFVGYHLEVKAREDVRDVVAAVLGGEQPVHAHALVRRGVLFEALPKERRSTHVWEGAGDKAKKDEDRQPPPP